MVSVVIALYNNCSLTEACLASLARTTRLEDIEVICVDNASSDKTGEIIPLLGKRLFSSRFRYVRLEQNRNFSGANNLGASLAQGDALFLLNNDTLLSESWLPPLLCALTEKNTGAVGPLLLYPEQISGCVRVQHLGVVFSPFRQVSHLYEYFPKDHVLVRKKRRFQVITAAAMLLPRRLFLEMGGFDERFKNGFEDVDLCVRLQRRGYRQVVESASVLFHYGSSSEGRKAHDVENARLCQETCGDFIEKNELDCLRQDGYTVGLSEWLSLEPRISSEMQAMYEANARSIEALEDVCHKEPYWISGMLALARKKESLGMMKEAKECYDTACLFCSDPRVLVPYARFALSHGQKETYREICSLLESFLLSREERARRLHDMEVLLREEGEMSLAGEAVAYLAENSAFSAGSHARIEAMCGLAMRM